MSKTLIELEEEMVTLRKECYFARGTMPIEEWREYHPRIAALKQKIEEMNQIKQEVMIMQCEVCKKEASLKVNGHRMCKYCFAWGVLVSKESREISVESLPKAIGTTESA